MKLVDKVFYRSSKSVTLNAVSYKLEDTKFVDSKGNQLSDHYPLSVQFQYTKQSGVSLRSAFGGQGGIAFNYMANLPNSMPTKVTLRSGNRVDVCRFNLWKWNCIKQWRNWWNRKSNESLLVNILLK